MLQASILLAIGGSLLGWFLLNKPWTIARLLSFTAPASAYPPNSDAHKGAKLMREEPAIWLNENPEFRRLFRHMGYGLYIMAGVGAFISSLLLLEIIIRFLVSRFV
jgi:hypothetical protein